MISASPSLAFYWTSPPPDKDTLRTVMAALQQQWATSEIRPGLHVPGEMGTTVTHMGVRKCPLYHRAVSVALVTAPVRAQPPREHAALCQRHWVPAPGLLVGLVRQGRMP